MYRLSCKVSTSGVYTSVKYETHSPWPFAMGPLETGLLLGNLGKNGFNLFGVCRVIFDDNIKNGDFQKVGTTPPIEKALVN